MPHLEPIPCGFALICIISAVLMGPMSLLNLISIRKATSILNAGGVVGIPTETVYGLAARIDNSDAVKKIFATKQRPFFDPLIVHISAWSDLEKLTSAWTDMHDLLAREFWPGSLTFVVPKRPEVHNLITAGLPTVGIRWPAHPLTQKLISKVGPLAAPSANRFGKTSPTRAQHVREEFNNEVYVLDGGPCRIGIESTIIELDADQKKIWILRPGLIHTLALNEAVQDRGWSAQQKKSIDIQAPGQLDAHYRPSLPLIIVGHENTLSVNEKEWVASNFKADAVAGELRLNSNPSLAARELYAEMRSLSKQSFDYLLFRKSNTHNGDDWAPICDRLKRAATVDFSSF